jgi:exosome complex exonuclease DIS3/RRP44
MLILHHYHPIICTLQWPFYLGKAINLKKINDIFFINLLCRYADIIVHRLLAVCVGADSTYPDLLDKKKSHELCHNLNYRHRMAQYAGRASVALHTHVINLSSLNLKTSCVFIVKQ